MDEVLDALQHLALQWWTQIDWASPWWWLAAGALTGLLVGLLLGFWIRRRHNERLVRSADVLAALERVMRDDKAGAFRILSQATRQANAPPEVYLALASLLRSMGHADRSAHVHRAVLQRPDLDSVNATRASLGLAGDYLTLDRADEAEAVLSALPRKLRKQPALLALRRRAAIRSGDWKEALAATNLLARYEDSRAGVADVYCHIAAAALTRGDEDDAAANFRRALRRHPDHVQAREGLARIYIAQRKFFRARRNLARALELNADLAPRLLPMMRVALGSIPRFRQYLEGLYDEGVASPWVELELAELCYSDDDVDQAMNILGDAAFEFPGSVDVREAYLNLLIAVADDRTIFDEVDRFMELAGRRMPRFVCTSCDHREPSTFVQCPRCASVGTVQYTGS